MRITKRSIRSFRDFLSENEREINTIEKYTHDLNYFAEFVDDRNVTKKVVLEFKRKIEENYAPSSVNSMLAAVNGYLKFMKKQNLCVKPLKIQRSLFSSESKELTKAEYERLIRTALAENNERLALVLQTIGSTGIRVSELKFITVDAIQNGSAKIFCKSKFRVVFLPNDLRRLLKNYVQRQKISEGAVFVTRCGKPLDRSNIWREMKKLCGKADVSPTKVFPHNLRHLFARMFYSLKKDLSRLADILGHSSISTTRIYMMESGSEHAKQLNDLNLVLLTT